MIHSATLQSLFQDSSFSKYFRTTMPRLGHEDGWTARLWPAGSTAVSHNSESTLACGKHVAQLTQGSEVKKSHVFDNTT